jgi:FkbM family methyltransferase
MSMISTLRSTASPKLREAGFRLMCKKPVNIVLRRLARPLLGHLPWSVVHSIPLIGETSVDLPDGRRLVLVSDGYDSLASRMSWTGIDGFEPESQRLFLKLAESSRLVLDVGSHIGLYALLAAVGRPERTAVAFEPVLRNVGYLRNNVIRNAADNIIVEEVAVGDRDGSILLKVPDTLRLPATATLNEGSNGGVDTTEVPIVSLDTYVTEHGLGPVDLIKIDVEGAESAVLRGARHIIEEHRPAIICEVLHGVGDTKAMTASFKGTDYRFFLVTGDGLVEHRELIGDPTFFHKNYLIIPDADIEERLGATLIKQETLT